MTGLDDTADPASGVVAARACGRASRWRRRFEAAAALTVAVTATWIAGASVTGAVDGPSGSSSYRLATLDNGAPAAWEPCRTVRWSVNLRGAPEGALEDVRVAVEKAGRASGLRFSYAGQTEAVPQQSWVDDGWPADTADLVLAWAVSPRATSAERSAAPGAPVSDLLSRDPHEDAVGGWYAEYSNISSDGGNEAARITAGYVVLDASAAAKFYPGLRPADGPLTGGRPPLVRLLMHELGHTMGLEHVNDERQVMSSRISSRKGTWGLGDRAGLAATGGTCPPR